MRVSPRLLLRWVMDHQKLARQLAAGLPRPAGGHWAAGRRRTGKPWPLVLYSQVAWDDVWQRPQEMARGLARHRPVLFCSPVQIHQTAGSLRGRWKPVRTEMGGRLLVLSPQILTGEYRIDAVRRLNRVIMARALKTFLTGRRFIFLTNSPFVDDLVRQLQPAVLGYDVIDDFCAFEWAPGDSRRRESWILNHCDFATAGTHSLYLKYIDAPGMQFLASGVDTGKLTKPSGEPADLRGLPRPRLLYVGTLNDRVDGALFAQTAEAFPNGTLVIVGPRRATFSAPEFPRNVVELGLKPHDSLPGYYQHCDIGLMPFADNEAARAINPVKTLEYLACGLPVISTPVPDVERFYTPPVVVRSPEDWPDEIARLLESDTEDTRQERRRFAEGRSWKTLVRSVERRLRDFEEARPGTP